MLNRLLLEPAECEIEDGDRLVAHLAPDDPRTKHIRSHLKAKSGESVRAGVLDCGVTDEAVIEWSDEEEEENAEGKEKEVGGTSSTLHIELGSAKKLLRPLPAHERPKIDLLLCMPRPNQFVRLLKDVSSMGIGTLWVTDAARMDKHYFRSHLLVEENKDQVRTALVQGLEQSGDTAVPRFMLRRGLRKLLREEFSDEENGTANDEENGTANSSAEGEEARVPLIKLACHPERTEEEGFGEQWADAAMRPRRLRDVVVPPDARVLLAIGPERGWDEPGELELLKAHGFELVTLGPRTLRSDVACISLLAVANELWG